MFNIALTLKRVTYIFLYGVVIAVITGEDNTANEMKDLEHKMINIEGLIDRPEARETPRIQGMRWPRPCRCGTR